MKSVIIRGHEAIPKEMTKEAIEIIIKLRRQTTDEEHQALINRMDELEEIAEKLLKKYYKHEQTQNSKKGQ